MASNKINIFGKTIHNLRISKNLSKSELSRRSKDKHGNKISIPYISLIENGNRKLPSIKYRRALARGLGLSFQKLCQITGTSVRSHDSRLKQLFKKFDSPRQLAKRANLSVKSIYAYEYEPQHSMSAYTVARLSRALGVKPSVISQQKAAKASKILDSRYFRTGQHILQLRLKDGISQSGLAKQVGISQNELSAIERGVHHGTSEMLRKIANVLHIKVSDLKVR